MPAPAFSYAPPSSASPAAKLLGNALSQPGGQQPQAQNFRYHNAGVGPVQGQSSSAVHDPDLNANYSGVPHGYDPKGGNGKGYTPGGGGGGVMETTDPQGHQHEVPIYNSKSYGSGAVGGGGGVAGGQQVLQPGGFGMPDVPGGHYTQGGAFDDPNAGNIYGVINNEIDQRANQRAPRVGDAHLYGGASIAPTMMTSGAQLDTGNDLQYQAAQNAQINQLASIASGQGPSVAATTAAQQRDANVAASMAMLGSQRGASSTAGGLLASQTAAAGADNAAAQQAALGRAQEAMSAQQQLTGALGGARGQTQATSQYQANLQQQADLANQAQYNQTAQQQAGLYQQAGLANAGAQNQFDLANQQATLGQEGLNNQAYNAGLSAYMGQNQQDITNSTAYQSMLEQEQLQKYGIDNNVAIQQQQMAAQAGASGVAALGALATLASDERLKEAITPGDKSVRSFLQTIEPHSYEYKDKKHGAGRYVSPMAQELERHPLGKSAVVDTAEGKKVIYDHVGGGPGRLPGFLLGALSMLNRDVETLSRRLTEKEKGKSKGARSNIYGR